MHPPSKRYAVYALSAFVLVNVFAFVDRQILAVLAEDIKADLGLSDAELGFIFGTAISVFYVIFSIPLARLADVWTRKNVLAGCVAAWSAMIFLTGCARSFVSFAVFRAGVGVGEAGCWPALMSLIADYFSPRLRSTAMSIAAAGVPIGGGLGLLLGGYVLDAWHGLYPDPANAPLGLKGWQVAFFVVAVPGPFLALWLWSLREPQRGQNEGLVEAVPSGAQPRPFVATITELAATLPVLSLVPMSRHAGAARRIILNLAIAFALAGGAAGLIAVTGSPAQWIAVAVGVYCVATWLQNLALRDPAAFAMIVKCRTLTFANLGVAAYVFVIAGIAGWFVPFMIRAYDATAAEAGAIVGVILAACGLFGNVLGGALADILERRTDRAKIYVMLLSLALAAPAIVTMLHAQSKMEAYSLFGIFYFAATLWYGIGPALANSLVTPRVRGISTAFYLIVFTLLGAAIGPYTMGFVSDSYAASGVDAGEALRKGILLGSVMLVPAGILLSLAAVFLPADQAALLDRASGFGPRQARVAC